MFYSLIKAKGTSLAYSQLGCMMVEPFPVRELFDLEYTGNLKKTLSDIERSKFEKETFLSMIKAFTNQSVANSALICGMKKMRRGAVTAGRYQLDSISVCCLAGTFGSRDSIRIQQHIVSIMG